ncbi:ribonuclease HII [Mycoplasma sp. P36-A1]|uniref:ribonuclease HII n=1 Tax=Mycoplasma sp. P36-A1 TaxID=3252900 RepID=UPI003C2F1024
MSNLLSNYDLDLLKKYDYIIGIDEVGRGCLAGPLVVCGAIMSYENLIDEVNDSKKLSEKKREKILPLIKDNVLDYFVLEVNNDIVDEINIYQATKQAMQHVAKKLNRNNTLILTDAMPLNMDNNIDIIKGDATSYAIACASIIAKVYRDHIMVELDQVYPEYGFAKHKGYGTKQHKEALIQYGYLDKIHRKSYEPIKSMISKQMKLF